MCQHFNDDFHCLFTFGVMDSCDLDCFSIPALRYLWLFCSPTGKREPLKQSTCDRQSLADNSSGAHSTQMRMSLKSNAFQNEYFRSNFNHNHQTLSQFCTCHDSSTVVTCAKLWQDLMVIIEMTRVFFPKIWVLSRRNLCDNASGLLTYLFFVYKWNTPLVVKLWIALVNMVKGH